MSIQDKLVLAWIQLTDWLPNFLKILFKVLFVIGLSMLAQIVWELFVMIVWGTISGIDSLDPSNVGLYNFLFVTRTIIGFVFCAYLSTKTDIFSRK